jgi:hypothetical protein
MRSPEDPSATFSPDEIQSPAFKQAAADCRQMLPDTSGSTRAAPTKSD